MKPYYQDKWVTIYHGDCREILPQLDIKCPYCGSDDSTWGNPCNDDYVCKDCGKSFNKLQIDLILTDPPYDIHAGHGGGEFGERNHLVLTGGFTNGGCDYSFLRDYRNWFCFCSRNQLSSLIAIAEQCERWNLLTWCKTNPVPTCCNKYLPDVEFIVHGFSASRLFGDMSVKSSYFLHSCGDKATRHPNEKPVLLLLKLITLGSEKGNLILDPFLGSGTTCYCAKKLNRHSIGIEIEEKYCEIAARRCSQEVMDFTDSKVCKEGVDK